MLKCCVRLKFLLEITDRYRYLFTSAAWGLKDVGKFGMRRQNNSLYPSPPSFLREKIRREGKKKRPTREPEILRIGGRCANNDDTTFIGRGSPPAPSAEYRRCSACSGSCEQVRSRPGLHIPILLTIESSASGFQSNLIYHVIWRRTPLSLSS